MSRIIDELKRTDHKRYLGGLDFFKYIGPGLLVTVGFIDPGNWASNFAAGSEFGYALLWVVTLSTIMLIVLQHNVAHLGIVTGLCLSESNTAIFVTSCWQRNGTEMFFFHQKICRSSSNAENEKTMAMPLSQLFEVLFDSSVVVKYPIF